MKKLLNKISVLTMIIQSYYMVFAWVSQEHFWMVYLKNKTHSTHHQPTEPPTSTLQPPNFTCSNYILQFPNTKILSDPFTKFQIDQFPNFILHFPSTLSDTKIPIKNQPKIPTKNQRFLLLTTRISTPISTRPGRSIFIDSYRYGI